MLPPRRRRVRLAAVQRRLSARPQPVHRARDGLCRAASRTAVRRRDHPRRQGPPPRLETQHSINVNVLVQSVVIDSFTTKLRVYQAMVLSVGLLIYAAETWTPLAADVKVLEAFHMKCRRQILGIRWFDFVSNIDVLARTGLTPLSVILAARRISVFGHIARLENDVPVHMALRNHVDLSVGRPPGRDWKRRPGRPRARWIDQVRRDSNTSPVELWRRAVRSGHGAGATHRLSPATRS